MPLILDLAVAALALLVIGSLALLAWTLGVNGVRASSNARGRVSAARASVRALEVRLSSTTTAPVEASTGTASSSPPGESTDR